MRDSVRRLCSPLTASKPSPIATRGTRNDSRPTSGKGVLRVNSRRNRNGSSAVLSLIGAMPRLTTTMALAVTRPISTTTRMLLKWSAISFSVTTPKPCKAEPSRCMALSFVGLEVTGVDRLQARLLDRKPEQATATADHRRCRLRPHVVVGCEPPAVRARWFDRLDARHRGKPLGEPLPFGFDLDAEPAAEDFAAELLHRADERDVAPGEQRDAVADTLHALEQVRRQQHAHANLLEAAN